MTEHGTLLADGIAVSLRGREVLANVTLAVARREVLAVVGANGAGKSTLLRCLAGLVAPTSGAVRLGGRPLAGLGLKERARAIAYLPQERSVHWPLTVATVVGLGRLPHRPFGSGESEADRAAVARAAEAMELSQLLGRPVTELSGGERARVLIARALAQETDILIADEPAAGLDPAHQLELFARLAALARTGRGIVVALHDLWLAARFADRVAVLKQGRLLAAGAVRDILTPAQIAAAFGVRAHCGEADGVPFVLPIAPAP